MSEAINSVIVFTPTDSKISSEIACCQITKTKLLRDYPESLFVALSLLSRFLELNNYHIDFDDTFESRLFISPNSNYALTDFEGAHDYEVEKKHYIRAKKALKELGFIQLHSSSQRHLNSQGKVTFTNTTGTTYTASEKLLQIGFDKTNTSLLALYPELESLKKGGSDEKVMTQLHSGGISFQASPILSFSSNSLSISHSTLPTNQTVNSLLHSSYSKKKFFKDDCEMFGVCVWLLLMLVNGEFHSSDAEIADILNLSKKKVTKTKLALVDLGFVETQIQTLDKVKASTYRVGRNYHELSFKRGSQRSISISFEKKERSRTSSKKASTTKTTNHIRHKSGDVVVQKGNLYSFSVSTNVHFPTNEHITQLLNSTCGEKPLSKNKDRLRACVTIIDLIRRDYYNEWSPTRVDEMVVVEVGDQEYVCLDNSDARYRHISQNRFQTEIGNQLGTKYNSEGLSEAKETLQKLGWLEVRQSQRSETKNNRINGSGQRYKAPNLSECETKSYCLSDTFYAGIGDSRSSSDSVVIEKVITTTYRGLAMAEIDPKVFDVFEATARARNWNKPTRSHQLSLLKNFDSLRGYADKKSYKSVSNSRIYTTISMLPRQFRPYILIDGEETVEVDIKSAHSIFLTVEMDDKQEVKEWLDIVGGNYESQQSGKKDIYYYLIDKLGVHPDHTAKFPTREAQRDRCKLALNAYYNGASNQENMDSNLKFNTSLFDFMNENFPNVHKTIRRMLDQYRCSGMDGAALRLQEVESDIIGTYFMEQPQYTCISIHDGLMVKRSEVQMFIDAITKRAKSLYGLDIIVEEK